MIHRSFYCYSVIFISTVILIPTVILLSNFIVIPTVFLMDTLGLPPSHVSMIHVLTLESMKTASGFLLCAAWYKFTDVAKTLAASIIRAICRPNDEGGKNHLSMRASKLCKCKSSKKYLKQFSCL